MSDTGAGLERIHSVGGCLARIVLGGMSGLWLLACLAVSWGDPVDLWLIAVAAVTAFAALTTRFIDGWAAIAAGLSLLTTVLVAATPAEVDQPSMLIEISGLMVLTARVVWRTRRDRLVVATALMGATIIAEAQRAGPPFYAVVFSAPLAVLVAISIGAGLYLRALDGRRARALREARRDERLELARDLHDFVAHHITGIVVQAQAARFTAQSGAAQTPEQIDRTFAGIEKAGTEALTSMRRMVGLLRDAQDGAAPADGDTEGATRRSGASAKRPVADLAQVEELVAGFTDLPATLYVDPGLGDLPPEVAASVHRIVQEALTNTRKHAADATEVRVGVARVPGGIEVSVRDNGQGRGRRLPSSGFGLVGLTERVQALGGRMYAGRRPEGGWEVVAVFPADGVLRESRP